MFAKVNQVVNLISASNIIKLGAFANQINALETARHAL